MFMLTYICLRVNEYVHVRARARVLVRVYASWCLLCVGICE
jgi:thiol:disulfide interchange protein